MGRGVSAGAGRGGGRKEGPGLSPAALAQGLDPQTSRRVAPSLPLSRFRSALAREGEGLQSAAGPGATEA